MQQSLNDVLLQQLRDVHTPAEIGWWPLAPGWWIVIGLLIFTAAVLVLLAVRNKQRDRYRHAALAELNVTYQRWLQQRDPLDYLQHANAILKRTVLHLEGSTQAARQTGRAWTSRLSLMASQPLSESTQHALSESSYQARAEVDIDAINNELLVWLKSHQRLVAGDLQAGQSLSPDIESAVRQEPDHA